MIPDVSKALIWLENHSQVLRNIQRGLERETLRVNKDGTLAITGHPKAFGSALTHKWITTDFAEALLEFITPVDSNINCVLAIMRDIHRYTARSLDNEYMWPLSMPCCIKQEEKIELAQYGSSNIGRLKTLYREGLKNRYGAIMQIISGVHYNFSLPITFWWKKFGKIDKETVSAGYFCLIRNYYRFGWVIPYLFGASPAISSSFLQKKNSDLPFKKTNSGIYYLPYSTSLRLSDLGYSNRSKSNLYITYNTLYGYIKGLRQAVKTPLKEYQKIGLEKDGKRLQINSNVLQIENELYTPIRPKRVTSHEETLSSSLQKNGIEYVEVRSLDINFFSPIGVDEQQIRFLDLFMIWCVLADAPRMSRSELLCSYANWNRVILEGRKPGITLKIGNKNKKYPLSKIGVSLFRDLKHIAKILDSTYSSKEYQKVCDDLVACFVDPELTFSAQILRSVIKNGIREVGCALATKYHNVLRKEPLEILTEADFITERELSISRQREIEETNNEETFEDFLEKKVNRFYF